MSPGNYISILLYDQDYVDCVFLLGVFDDTRNLAFGVAVSYSDSCSARRSGGSPSPLHFRIQKDVELSNKMNL